MSLPGFTPVADFALLVELATEVSDTASDQVLALDRAIAAADIAGVQEVIPALVNLSVIFDPMLTDHKTLQAAIDDLFPLPDSASLAPAEHLVPVCYDPDLTPDVASVAQTHGVSIEDVIKAHSSASYRVGMYGFAPGFAYLSGVPAAIQVPRKAQAARGIPVGSVMIAGPLCIVTTLVMPTGWTIIGRSATRIMTGDPARPFLFDVGDRVRFEPVSRSDLPSEMQTP